MVIDIKPDRLRSIAQQMDSHTEEYGKIVTEMYGHVTEMEPFFKGQDSNTFHTQIEGFRPRLNSLKELMQDYARFLRDAAQLMEERQVDIVGKFQGLSQ